MKSENKTKGYKMSKYLTVSFLFVAFFMPNFLHANGQGVNGTNLSGESIPVHLDRLVEVHEIENVYKTCLSEMSRDVIYQLEGDKCKIDESNNRERLSDVKGIGSFSYLYEYTCQSQKKRIAILPQQLYIRNQFLNLPSSENSLPFFTYSTQYTDYQYGDLGEIISVKKVAKDLQIPNSSNVESLYLINDETKRQTNISINLKKLSLCLSSFRKN